MPHIESPLIIDIEASGFGPMSYPIEVGLALDNGHKYCTLIVPAEDWTHWDDDAEQVHGIRRDILEAHGRTKEDVADQLNELLAGKTVYSDGWVVDKPWLTTLFHAARREMKFQVSPLEAILSEEQMARWHETKDKVIGESDLARHRASLDAWVIQETFQRSR